MKIKLLFVLVLSTLLLLCACNTNENSSSLPEGSTIPESSSIPENSESESIPVSSEESNESFYENSFEREKGIIDENYSKMILPDLTGADKTKLSLFEEDKWCLNGGSFPQTTEHEQLFVQDETAKELAAAISLIDNGDFHYYNFNDFENISDANNQYLLAASIISTPYIHPEGVYDTKSENIVSKISTYLSEVFSEPIEIRYAEDVEKTFHYLFGDNAEFKPELLYYPTQYYFPEAEIFISFSDGYIYIYNYPQIISYREESGKYYVEAVMLNSFDYGDDSGDNGKVSSSLSKDDILARQHINYTFEKAKDGHFVLCSISTAE